MLLRKYFVRSLRYASSISGLSTAERYPSLGLKRKPHYGSLNSADIDFFRKILDPSSQVVQDSDQLVDYNIDWMKTCQGQSKLAVLPRSTEQVSKILKYCNQRNLAIAPRGGNTGLVGGSVPVFDEIALSLRLMDKIISIDSNTGIVTCEAGLILDTLDKRLQDQGFTVPLDLGARHSCQIGGNIATNAGGVRLLRYGSLRANVLGLEFVLADGTIVDCLSKMRKDNTGYDLKSLMIGAEGTLGLITKVALLCPPKPQSVNVCLVALESFQQILELFKLSRHFLSEILSAFEFFDINSREAVEANLKQNVPLGTKTAPFYVLIETSGSNQSHDFDKLELLTQEVLNSKLASENGIVLAQDLSQQKTIWRVREEIAVALQRDGYVYKFDISLSQTDFPIIHKTIEERLRAIGKHNFRVASYGHVGDGNLHLNITSPAYDADIMSALDPFIFEFVKSKGGSISAEHGLGLRKRKYINYSKSSEAIVLMQKMKRLLDPNGILNPYKTIDPDMNL